MSADAIRLQRLKDDFLIVVRQIARFKVEKSTKGRSICKYFVSVSCTIMTTVLGKKWPAHDNESILGHKAI